jgi:hypothetical protein
VAAADVAARTSRAPRASRAAGRAWLWGTIGLSAAAFALAMALAPPASAPPGRGLAWLLFVASSGHVASTGWVLGNGDVRQHAASHPWRYLRVPVILVLGTAAVAVATPQGMMDWLLLPYFGWQFYHFQKQNLGMAALAASSSGASPLTTGERRVILAAGWAGIAGLLAHPALLQVHAVTPVLRGLFPVARLAFGVAVVTGMALLARRGRRGLSTPGSAAAYLMALAFFGPVFATILTRGSPYAAVGGLTIAHGLQYLLLTGLLAASGSGHVSNGGGGNAHARALRLALLVNVVLIGGAILAAGSHLDEASGVARAGYGAYLGVVMAHFVIDAGLWRLRDPFPRRFLAGRLPHLVRMPMDRKTI